MIHYTNESIFDLDVQVLVNTINCRGLMGAGLALECKKRFPDMYADYVRRCAKREVLVGFPYIFYQENNPHILNFPTKKHWRNRSKLAWIERGLLYFVEHFAEWEIGSVVFPQLGCRNGGLDWAEVKPLMESFLGNLDIKIWVCIHNQSSETYV